MGNFGNFNQSWLHKGVRVDRIITHWTAGSYTISDLDKEHYHFLVDSKGIIHRGYFSVADNQSTSDGRYAAHTYMLNTCSVGISAAAMAGAQQGKAGPASMLSGSCLRKC